MLIQQSAQCSHHALQRKYVMQQKKVEKVVDRLAYISIYLLNLQNSNGFEPKEIITRQELHKDTTATQLERTEDINNNNESSPLFTHS